MIKQDTISKGLTAMAIFIVIYLSTFEQSVIVIFPAFLLLCGLALQTFLARKYESGEEYVKEPVKIGVYTIIAFVGFIGASLFSPALAKFIPQQIEPKMLGIAGTDTVLYGILMAIGEEQFFRGAITNYLLNLTPSPIVAVSSSGLIFCVYHLAVYGTSINSLIYVFIAGLFMSFVAYRSEKLSPSMLAHILNNILAYARVV